MDYMKLNVVISLVDLYSTTGLSAPKTCALITGNLLHPMGRSIALPIFGKT